MDYFPGCKMNSYLLIIIFIRILELLNSGLQPCGGVVKSIWVRRAPASASPLSPASVSGSILERFPCPMNYIAWTIFLGVMNSYLLIIIFIINTTRSKPMENLWKIHENLYIGGFLGGFHGVQPMKR